MEELSQSVDGTLERARETKCVLTMIEQDEGWSWPALDPVVFAQKIAEASEREVALSEAEAGLIVAAGSLDVPLNALAEETSLGLRLARLHFKSQPAKAGLFAGLRLNNTGRESRQQQGLDFELSWAQADAGWVFQEGLSLAVFRARRLALRGLEEAHGVAAKAELYARGLLHESARWLHGQCVDWYEAASATFPEESAAGVLVRTIPTSYDPNRPPGPLVFTRSESPAAGVVALRWRAPRGEKYILWALAPGATEWVRLLDGAQENGWSAEHLAAGTWRFKGRALNKFGAGTESAAVPVAVAAVEAA